MADRLSDRIIDAWAQQLRDCVALRVILDHHEGMTDVKFTVRLRAAFGRVSKGPVLEFCGGTVLL